MKPISDVPQEMSLAEALVWVHRREAAELECTRMCLEEMRREGVAGAYMVTAETLVLLERNNLMYDFHRDVVERQL